MRTRPAPLVPLVARTAVLAGALAAGVAGALAAESVGGDPAHGGTIAGGPVPAPPVTAASERDPACAVEGADNRADAERARVACELARARIGGLLGHDIPAVLVMVEARAGYRIGILDQRAVVLWPSSDAMAVRAGTSAAATAHARAQWRETLPHEIGHALTAAHFFPDGEFTADGYGTPLPDWFEEGLAIWAEPMRHRDRRLAAARALPRDRLDLRAILSGEHPAARDAAALTARDGAAPPVDDDLWDFYPQSFAVLAFLHDRGGPDAVRELATRFMAGRTDPDTVVGLPGLPDTFEAVEADWSDWIAD